MVINPSRFFLSLLLFFVFIAPAWSMLHLGCGIEMEQCCKQEMKADVTDSLPEEDDSECDSSCCFYALSFFYSSENKLESKEILNKNLDKPSYYQNQLQGFINSVFHPPDYLS